MTTYTAEIVAALTAKYLADRKAGKTNPVIITALSDEFGFSIPSIRTKLMVEKVYVKDTDAEKTAKNGPAKAKSTKEKGPTKLQVAKEIVEVLDIAPEFADDVAKMKVDALAAVLKAVKNMVEVASETPDNTEV